jgi:hypothetical protein
MNNADRFRLLGTSAVLLLPLLVALGCRKAVGPAASAAETFPLAPDFWKSVPVRG